MKLLRWDGWFLHYNTGYLRKHKPSVPCSVLLSNYYMIIKPCSRNIKDSTNLAYSRNMNIEVPVRLSFQSLPLLFGKKKSTKYPYFETRHCFIHPPLIFATQSLIISLDHITLWFSLLKVCECNVMKDFLLRDILRSFDQQKP